MGDICFGLIGRVARGGRYRGYIWTGSSPAFIWDPAFYFVPVGYI